MPRRLMTTIALLSVAPLAHAAAQPDADPDAPPQGGQAPAIERLETDWTVRIEPYAAYIGPAGDLRMPSTTTRGGEFALSSLNLDSPRLLPAGRIQATRGKWRIGFSGLAFGADDRGAVQGAGGQIGAVPFAAGDELISDLSYESFDLLVSYRVWQHSGAARDGGRVPLVAGADVIGGVRFHHADFSIRNRPVVAPAPGTPLSVDADELFAEPVIGGRLDLTLAERFGIEVESVAGGFGFGDRTSFSFSIDAGFAYRPVPSVGVKVGYRMLLFGLSDGDGAEEFEWSGSMAGLYFGAQISF
jgi:opacity protein-like surface antigen